jgi:undecaprenyl-diphosphatase
MLQQLVRYDLSLCLLANRACRAESVRLSFAIVSRLGNGVFWYALMLVLPLVYGGRGATAALHMLGVGLCGYGIYKLIKQGTERPRPCSVHEAIRLGADPLDQYSFPSGHTLHAVGFTLVALHYFPELGWLLLPFAALVAASRVVLGLHYPTDVVCGALIGSGLGLGSIALLG